MNELIEYAAVRDSIDDYMVMLYNKAHNLELSDNEMKELSAMLRTWATRIDHVMEI
jgi:galactose-1-phosphate uridylyltransferase